MGKNLADLLLMAAFCLGVSVVGSSLAIAWYRLTSKGPLERDKILFLIKLFFGIGAVGMVFFLLTKYG